jgi:integrase/recombinase XerD
VTSSIAAIVVAHLRALQTLGLSESTISARRLHLRRFERWSRERGVLALSQISRQVVGDYQVDLAIPGESPTLTIVAQRHRLVAVRMFARWAQRAGLIDHDPTALLELPRLPQRLPQSVLTSLEAERVLATPSLETPLGLRDRAVLELLYSSGLRRSELIALDLADLDRTRGVLLIRLGKGRKDRYVPVGRRALDWIGQYLTSSRPALLGARENPALFVGRRGARLSRARMNERLRAYLVQAAIAKPGSCHIWRHTMATLMHERGADLRDLQVLLGHAQISTTAIYTHISTERLQEVHWRTHPANRYLRRTPRPGRAAVNSPAATTATPFTITHGIPTA